MELRIHPGLEAAIEQSPGEVQPYLLLADWLQEQGDSHGEAIALHCRACIEGDEKLRARLERAWREHRRRLERDLWPHEYDATVQVKFRWFAGFVEALGITIERAPVSHEAREDWSRLLTHPLCRFVRRLSVGNIETELQGELAQLPSRLSWTQHLTTLRICNKARLACSELPAPLPALRRLELGVRSLWLDRPLPKAVESLALPCSAFLAGDQPGAFASVQELDLLALEERSGDLPYWQDLQRLLDTPGLRNVRRLRMPGAPPHVKGLARSGLLDQLVELELDAELWDAASLYYLLRQKRRFQGRLRFVGLPLGDLRWPRPLVENLREAFEDRVEFERAPGPDRTKYREMEGAFSNIERMMQR